jgi:hypothetical protein
MKRPSDAKEQILTGTMTLLAQAVILALAIHLYAAPLFAGTATLTWNKPTTYANGDPLGELSGYIIYYGTFPRTGNIPPGGYNNSATITDPDQLTYAFNSLPDGYVYYFSVVAFNAAGESDLSNEGSKAVCSNANARILGRGYYLTAQGVYDALNNGETAQLHAVNFTESLLLDDIKSVTLRGGFICDYTSNSGFTIVNGSITIRMGNVNLENVIIR